MPPPLPSPTPPGEPRTASGTEEPLPLRRIVGLILLLGLAGWLALIGAWVVLTWVAGTLIPTSIWIIASLLAVAGMLPV